MHRDRAAKRATPAESWVSSPVLKGMRAYERARRVGIPFATIRAALEKVQGIGATGALEETWDVAKLAAVCADLIATTPRAKTPGNGTRAVS